MLNQITKKWKDDSKIIKFGVITKHDFKLIAYNAVSLDYWVVLQKLNPSFGVRAGGTIDPYREKRIVGTSRGTLTLQICNGYVGIIPQKVTFTCSYCQLKGKPIDVGKMFGLENVFSKTVWIIV